MIIRVIAPKQSFIVKFVTKLIVMVVITKYDSSLNFVLSVA